MDWGGGLFTAFMAAKDAGKGPKGGSPAGGSGGGEPGPINGDGPNSGKYEESIFGAVYVSPDGTTYHGEAAKQAFADEYGEFHDGITGEGLDANRYASGGGFGDARNGGGGFAPPSGGGWGR